MKLDYTSTSISVEEITTKLAERINSTEKHLKVYYKINIVLNEYNGRMISKRLVTMFKDKYPELTVHLDVKDFLGYTLYIWGDGLSYSNRIIIYLKTMEDSPNRLDYLKTISNNGDWISAQEKHLEFLQEILKNSLLLNKYTSLYNTILEVYQDFVNKSEKLGIRFLFES